MCHPSCTECFGSKESDCINSGNNLGILYDIYNDISSSDITVNWNLNDICVQSYLDTDYAFIPHQNVMSLFKIAEGFSSIPTFYNKYSLSSTRTNTIPNLTFQRSRCVRAGPESLIVGSENLHLVRMVSN